MQVRCVWVILNNQVRVNFSTNCKCRHIYLSFSDHQIPSIRLPQSAGNGISETLDFKISRGSMPSDPPINLTPSALDFRAFRARKLVTKIPRSTPVRWWRSVSWQCIPTTWIDCDQSWGRINDSIPCICNNHGKSSAWSTTPPVWTWACSRRTRNITALVNKFHCSNKLGWSNICNLLKLVVFRGNTALTNKRPGSYIKVYVLKS